MGDLEGTVITVAGSTGASWVVTEWCKGHYFVKKLLMLVGASLRYQMKDWWLLELQGLLPVGIASMDYRQSACQGLLPVCTATITGGQYWIAGSECN